MSNEEPRPPHLSETEALAQEVEELEAKSASAARLFDIRRIIGWLFVVYGIIVTAMGINPSDAELDKAQGININLWTGLSMLALGIVFLLWMYLRPVIPPSAEEIAAAMQRPDSH